jgi:hypothetical protein
MRKSLGSSLCTAALRLTGPTAARAQVTHPAVCQAPPAKSTVPVNGPLLEKIVASLGDRRVLACLRGLRHMAEQAETLSTSQKVLKITNDATS